MAYSRSHTYRLLKRMRDQVEIEQAANLENTRIQHETDGASSSINAIVVSPTNNESSASSESSPTDFDGDDGDTGGNP